MRFLGYTRNLTPLELKCFFSRKKVFLRSHSSPNNFWNEPICETFCSDLSSKICDPNLPEYVQELVLCSRLSEKPEIISGKYRGFYVGISDSSKITAYPTEL